MSVLLVAGLVFAGALGLAVLSQPVGRPRPALRGRLEGLTAAGWMAREAAAARPPVFASAFLERALRPLLDDIGLAVGAVLRRLGIETDDLDGRLALVMPELTRTQFHGQQLACGLLLGAAFPAMNLVGLYPGVPWPAAVWLVAFVVGFASPVWVLRERLAARRGTVVDELPTALELLVLCASAGMSPEQALVETAEQLEGTLGAELRTVVREASLGRVSYGAALQALAAREGVAELRAMAEAWQRAHEQGSPMAPAMAALSVTARERERARLREAGGRASVRMVLPVAFFIFPVFLVIVLFPAGTQLLGFGR